jgi:hypothetical protein
MGAINGIVGEDFGVDLPEMQVPEQDLTVEKNMAKFSKTAEFRKLKAHFEERIKFYQGYMPDGRAVVESLPTPEQWVIANAIIGEFKAVLSVYEQAREAVEDVHRERA